MLPLGTGSQVRGSVIRPASICGVPAYKPTFGALNRHGGVDPSPSINHLGLLGATIEDIWIAAQQLNRRLACGGRGHGTVGVTRLGAGQFGLRFAQQSR
jgi:Asp-tRNA(Asn)/Glu-tRNA(Gln) amidotransferase A subunit family amidase